MLVILMSEKLRNRVACNLDGSRTLFEELVNRREFHFVSFKKGLLFFCGDLLRENAIFTRII